MEGYKMHTWNGEEEFPPVITIFGAPNYCDVYQNKSACFYYKKGDNNEMVPSIKQFNYTPHPFLLPENMNVFEWSMPFVTEKVSQMMNSI